MNSSPAVARNVSDGSLAMLVSPVMTVAVLTIYLLVFACSTPCNLLSLGALLSIGYKRHTPTSILAVNLSLSDLIYSVFLPLQVLYHLRGNNWLWDSALCSVSTNILFCNSYGSVLTTTAIAMERYCGVVHPLCTKHWRTPLRAVVVCVLIWAVVLITLSPLLRVDLTLRVRELNITTCFDLFPRTVFQHKYLAYLYFVTEAVLFNLLPFIVLICCYVAVAKALRRSTALTYGDERAVAAGRQALTVVTLATVCFVVCYLPINILFALHIVYTTVDKSLYQYYKLAVAINSLNCCFDPFVYYFASREFRKTLQRVTGRCCACCSSLAERHEPGTSDLVTIAAEQHKLRGL